MDRLSVGPLPRPDTLAVDYSGLDPTLDSCCRRDAEDSLKASAKRNVLRTHDRVAAYERSRTQQPQQQSQQFTNPHLVTVQMMSDHHSFEGCRCSYDPTKDGGHDYPALAELRRMLKEGKGPFEGDENKKKDNSDSDDDELDAFMEGFGGASGGTSSRAKSSRNGPNDNRSDDDDDSDDDNDDDPLLAELDSSPVLSEWERQRKQQIMQQIQRLETAKQHGYGGVHRPMHPSRVLRVAGLMMQSNSSSNRQQQRIPPSSCVVHLYHPDSTASASLDVWVEQVLAPRYLGTMFLRSNGYDTVRLERNLLKNQVSSSSNHSRIVRAVSELVDHPAGSLPALLVMQNGQLVNAICGFRGPEWNWIDPSTGQVVSEAVHMWLEHCDSSDDSSPVLRRDPPPLHEMCHLRPEELALLEHLRQSGNGATHSNSSREALLTAMECGVGGGKFDGNADDLDSYYYDCGLPGCRKPYAHQHVGNGVGDMGESSSTTSSGLPFTLGD